MGRPGGTDLAGILLDVRGVAQATVGLDRQHRHGAAEVVGHQHEPSGRMDAHIGRTGAAGANGIEQRQLPVGRIDGEGADRSLLVVADPIGLIGGIEPGSVGIPDQAARAGSHLVNAGGRHRPGGAIHPEEVDATTVAGREIHLRRQDIAERRAEGADIRHERPPGFVRSRRERTGEERRCPRQCDRGFEKRTPGTVDFMNGHPLVPKLRVEHGVRASGLASHAIGGSVSGGTAHPPSFADPGEYRSTGRVSRLGPRTTAHHPGPHGPALEPPGGLEATRCPRAKTLKKDSPGRGSRFKKSARDHQGQEELVSVRTRARPVPGADERHTKPLHSRRSRNRTPGVRTGWDGPPAWPRASQYWRPLEHGQASSRVTKRGLSIIIIFKNIDFYEISCVIMASLA